MRRREIAVAACTPGILVASPASRNLQAPALQHMPNACQTSTRRAEEHNSRLSELVDQISCSLVCGYFSTLSEVVPDSDPGLRVSIAHTQPPLVHPPDKAPLGTSTRYALGHRD